MSDVSRTAGSRHANWLELFFDLVMAAFVGQLAIGLHGDPQPVNFLTFIVLFFPAWWAWVNVMLTLNLFGERMTGQIWLLVSIAMFGVGMMAAASVEGLGERAWVYALGNSLLRLVLFYAWWSEGRRRGVPWYRPVLYCGVTAVLWGVSAAVPQPAQWWLWGTAILLEILLLSFLGRQASWLRQALNTEHLSERVGLFVVIVFGESVLAVFAELSDSWSLTSGLTALLAFAAISLLAWAFFTYGAETAERSWHRLQVEGNVGALRDTVMYLPFLVVVAVVLLSAGLGTAVAEPTHPLPTGAAISIACGIALFYGTNALIMLRYRDPLRAVLRWAIVGIALPLGLLSLAPVVTGTELVAGAVVVITVLVAPAAITRRGAGRTTVREER
ncbi:low temperature requirement protein A [Glaciibacter psychrotolerans]|uniref:Low temperature requirement protein LtrA n=1 Tax=Glaciibacter psychrotolerans TaxID=670054 RepID=A0A7Z0ECK9_9MICO|nr:low temperature requirement protein LtrA [Leifsonia psychrotolerans]